MKMSPKVCKMSLSMAVSCVHFAAVSTADAAVNPSPITIATVPVGNAGNAADVTGFGAVNYNYNIGEYDVTVSQYTAFLNAVATTDTYGLYDPSMAGTTQGNPGIIQSGSAGDYTYSIAANRGNYPVTDVSFWNATRFANWLNNGQPVGAEGAGTTETGTYDLLATSMDATLAVTPTNKNQITSSPADNNSVVRSATATWAVASENEWYKAAYYDPALNNGAGGYYTYPYQSNVADLTKANYYGLDTSPVGSYADPSYYGTYDQGGDVYQWNENIDYGYNVRDVRGGAFDSGGDFNTLTSVDFTYVQPWVPYSSVGFRVTEVPEPLSGGAVVLAAAGALARRPSKRSGSQNKRI